MRNYQATNGELPLLAAMRAPAKVEEATVAAFGEVEESAVKAAIRWAWLHRRIPGLSLRHAAELIGMKAPHFSNTLRGSKYLPLHCLNRFEPVMGNTAVSQTLERFRRLHEQSITRELADVVAEQLRRSA